MEATNQSISFANNGCKIGVCLFILSVDQTNLKLVNSHTFELNGGQVS